MVRRRQQRRLGARKDMKHVSMDKCAYDEKGNLFVDRIYSHNGRKNYIGELPEGTRHFTNYLLEQRANLLAGPAIAGAWRTTVEPDSAVTPCSPPARTLHVRLGQTTGT